MNRRLCRRVRRNMLLNEQPGQCPPDVYGTFLTLAEGDEVLLLILAEHLLKCLLRTLHPFTVQTHPILADRHDSQCHPWLLSMSPFPLNSPKPFYIIARAYKNVRAPREQPGRF